MSSPRPSPGGNPARLLSGRLITRNVVWNVVGLCVPLIVAVFAIPRLITALGTDRFGLLAMIWAVIGYFGLFDLGMGRALTKLVAERLGREDTGELHRLLWTALALMAGLGVLAALSMGAFAPQLIDHVLNVPLPLREESALALRILALALPAVILSAAFIGVLEAHQCFVRINAVRIPFGAFSFLGPLIAVQYTPNLVAATGALAAARLLSCLAYLGQCLRVMPALRTAAVFDRAVLGPLLSFGGWLTLSNIVGPLMVYSDRFLIGALLTMSAVAYYATPYEVVTRFWIVPEAVTAVLYPALATASAAQDARLGQLFGRGINTLLLIMLPPLALVVLFAPEALTVWLGPGFAEQSTAILRWLAVGVLINSIARVPYALLQGVGRPDLTAKLHLLELLPYVAALWILVRHFGLVGAAVAWTARIGLDAAGLFWLAAQHVPRVRAEIRSAVVVATGGTILMPLLALPEGLGTKSAWAVILLVVAAWLAYRETRGARSLPRLGGVAGNRR